ncbi:MAG: response regulator [Pseudomonadota bacterium]
MAQRVLIVEDEANIAESLSFLLERDGFDVVTLSDGASAMDKLNALRPSAVVLDVMLPNRSGFDLLSDIRSSADLAALPVLMLTAKGQARDRERAMEMGANAFVTKPFSNTDIVEQVRALVAGEQG